MSSTQSPTWNGLLFSRSEERDEHDSTPFVYVRHDPKISTGLKQTYAVPGILSSNVSTSDVTSSQAVFAYSLSKAANVTITVYDWNMNLVKNVVTNSPRLAGADDPTGNGRSTNRREDVWNGTNSTGKRVAVGVYYFKITATSGERSFGKIIVAK
jgi:flagellar hook assembly protein FlgD